VDAVFALVDWENFYVSCERVFDPALRDVPVVLLSNNDGCGIARSSEVKDAGVPMGAPYFQWEEELDDVGTVMRSSNHALYGDMSRRVMRELEAEALRIERYSIDEAFLTLPALSRDALRQQARQLQRRVRQRQGVPIRMGIGPTKTLAKVVDERAKAGDGRYVCPDGEALAAVLADLPVEEVWGLGSARAEDAGQGHLFRERSSQDDALMDAVDQINRTMERDTVGFAAAGVAGERDWTMKREMRSPHYTTRWSDLPVARA
jgi:DNA polymerase V